MCWVQLNLSLMLAKKHGTVLAYARWLINVIFLHKFQLNDGR